MEDNDYKMLMVLHKEGKITKAASELYMTQPALTKRIHKIEDELGVPIIVRSKTGIAFTSAGEYLVEQAKKISIMIRDTKSHILNTQNEVQGTLGFGAATAYAQFHLSKSIADYLSRYSKVDIVITDGPSDTIYSILRSNDIQLAVVRNEYPSWNAERIDLFSEPVCMVYSERTKRENLYDTTRIEYKCSPSIDSLTSKWLLQGNIPVSKNRVYSNNIGSVLQYVKTGIGFSILPYIMVADDDSIIKEPLFWADGTAFVRKTYLYYKEEYGNLATVSSFIDFVVENAEKIKGSFRNQIPKSRPGAGL